MRFGLVSLLVLSLVPSTIAGPLARPSISTTNSFRSAFSQQIRPPEERSQAVLGQRTPVSEREDVVKISVTLVQVDAVVTDKHGKPVTDLGEVTPLRLEPQADWRRISLAGSFKLSANARPGEYMIQLLITDTLASRKHRVASQWADFEIIDK